MIHLAVMLATGEGGTQRDQVEARTWYREAAERGSAHALRGLGAMLYAGEGGAPDQPAGWAYLELAAEAGDGGAAQLLQRWPGPAVQSDVEQIKREWRSSHRPLEPE